MNGRVAGRVSSVALGLVFLGAWLWSLSAGKPRVPDLPANPQRVLCIAPSLTETVCFLGAGDRLIGRSDFCDTPAEVLSLPAVGGFYNPRMEDLVRLEPDLVLAESNQTWLLERCHALDIPAVGIDLQTVDAIIKSLAEVGRLLNLEQHGQAESEALRDRVEQATVTLAEPPRVLWIPYRDPGSLTGILGFGPGGPTHEILQRAGAINALERFKVAAPTLTAEMILVLQPDVILDDQHFPSVNEGYADQAQAVWQPLLDQPPLRHTRLALLTDNVVNRPGPRIDRAIRVLAELVHGTGDP